MFRNKVAALVLAAGSMLSFVAPATAVAYDRNDRWDNRYENRNDRRMSDRDRRAYEARLREEARQRREWEKRNRNRNDNRYNNNNRNGYYDRFGNWRNNDYRR